MQLLGKYRTPTGRHPLPYPPKSEPILMEIIGTGHSVSAKMIHAILKELFASALQPCVVPYHVEMLKAASRWLRRTKTIIAISGYFARLGWKSCPMPNAIISCFVQNLVG